MNAVAGDDAAPTRRFRRLPGIVRWLHTYVSMLGFASLVFFALTGFTLNHAQALEAAETTHEVEGRLAPQWLADPIDKLAVVEHLRQAHAIRAALHDFVVNESECVLVFKAPGQSADCTVARATDEYQCTLLTRGALAILNDLHKGRDSGARWSWFLDVSAAVLLVAGVTGLWLLCYVRKRRGAGLAWAVVGTVVPIALYYLAVP